VPQNLHILTYSTTKICSAKISTLKVITWLDCVYTQARWNLIPGYFPRNLFFITFCMINRIWRGLKNKKCVERWRLRRDILTSNTALSTILLLHLCLYSCPCRPLLAKFLTAVQIRASQLGAGQIRVKKIGQKQRKWPIWKTLYNTYFDVIYC